MGFFLVFNRKISRLHPYKLQGYELIAMGANFYSLSQQFVASVIHPVTIFLGTLAIVDPKWYMTMSGPEFKAYSIEFHTV